MRRGDVYAHAQFDRRFAIISTDRLTEAGTAIVAELVPDVPAGTRGLLAVALRDEDPLPGALLAWRVNYVSVNRLGERIGRLTDETMEVVDMALRTAMHL